MVELRIYYNEGTGELCKRLAEMGPKKVGAISQPRPNKGPNEYDGRQRYSLESLRSDQEIRDSIGTAQSPRHGTPQ
jgi:hypothetical protein